MTLTLQSELPVHQACTHVKSHGGHKAAVRHAHNRIIEESYTYVCRTDIRGYYANINKAHLWQLLSSRITCPVMLDLLAQFLDYSVETKGLFHTPRLGIPRGCPLSPLLAGFHLHELDIDLSCRQNLSYVRFMDDLLILTRSRWPLKRAVVSMNRWLSSAGLAQHPDKTFIGRIEKGFDWLGYRFGAEGLCGLAETTINRFEVKLYRLYEQAQRSRTSHEDLERQVAEYIKRWQGWCGQGLGAGCQGAPLLGASILG